MEIIDHSGESRTVGLTLALVAWLLELRQRGMWGARWGRTGPRGWARA